MAMAKKKERKKTYKFSKHSVIPIFFDIFYCLTFAV